MGAHTRETPGKKYIGIFLFFRCPGLKTPVALRISRATNFVGIGCAAGRFVAREPFARSGNEAFQVRDNLCFIKLTSRLHDAQAYCGPPKFRIALAVSAVARVHGETCPSPMSGGRTAAARASRAV